MPISKALPSPENTPSWDMCLILCSPTQFPGQRAHPQGLLLAGDKARDTSSGQHRCSHLGCTSRWGEVQIPGFCPEVTAAWG